MRPHLFQSYGWEFVLFLLVFFVLFLFTGNVDLGLIFLYHPAEPFLNNCIFARFFFIKVVLFSQRDARELLSKDE